MAMEARLVCRSNRGYQHAMLEWNPQDASAAWGEHPIAAVPSAVHMAWVEVALRNPGSGSGFDKTMGTCEGLKVE